MITLLRMVAVVMPMMMPTVVVMAVMYFHHHLGLRRNRRSEAEDKHQCKEELFHSWNTLLDNGLRIDPVHRPRRTSQFVNPSGLLRPCLSKMDLMRKSSSQASPKILVDSFPEVGLIS